MENNTSLTPRYVSLLSVLNTLKTPLTAVGETAAGKSADFAKSHGLNSYLHEVEDKQK